MTEISTTYQSIAVIIVLYHPNENDKANVLRISEAYSGVIVDNSVGTATFKSPVNRMEYIPLYKNTGIAQAQNIGIQYLLQHTNAKYIVFLDQDSSVSIDYPLCIAKAFESVVKEFPNLAFIGPRTQNIDTGKEYKSIIHQEQKVSNLFIPRREVISSGGCTTRQILSAVGYNDASLFIDFVDFEWCWKAKSKGYICGIAPNITINHKVGRKTLSIGGFLIIISAPFRYYYQFRNHLWLIRKNYVPLQWKINIGIKHIARLLYFPLFIDSGFECWKYMIKGIIDGMKKHEAYQE